MSYRFRIPDAQAFSYEDALGNLSGVDLRCEGGQRLQGAWPRGVAHLLYVHGVSTRSVEALLDDDGFGVRLFSGACHEDYELALEVVCAVARRLDRDVVSEEGVRFTGPTRRPGYGRAWIDDHIRTLFKVILRVSLGRRDNDPLVVAGPVRPFVVGRRLAMAVSEAGQTDLDRAERLLARIRHFQYLDLPFLPVEATRLPDSERAVSLVRLRPGERFAVPKADVVELVSDASAFVRWDGLETLLGSRLSWLDEHTALVDAISPSDWPELLLRADDVADLDDGVAGHGSHNTWWSTQITEAPTEIFSSPALRESTDQDTSGVRRWWDVWRARR